MQPLISIIIPIYNSYNIIDECLQSLSEQTSNNFEVIFIDDKSKDFSIQNIEKKISKYHLNYRLLENEKNMGPGFTRNKGINESKGKYITFVDSDDYISVDFIENIEKIILDEQPDSILFDYYLTSAKTIKMKFAIQGNNGSIDRNYALAMCNGMCWGKVYKKQIIKHHNIKFPNIIRSEDLAFTKTYIDKCEKVYYLKKPLYYYRDNVNSIMHTANTLNIDNNVQAFNYMQQNINYGEPLKMIFLREYLYLIVQIMILKKYETRKIKQFIEQAEMQIDDCYHNIYIQFQPLYIKIILKFIQHKWIWPLKMVFILKKG